MPEDQPAKVTLGHLARAERICARRLKLEHGNTRANSSSNGRWRVSNRVTEEIRLAHPHPAAPADDHPEIRLLRFGSPSARATALVENPAVRFALLRRVDWLRDQLVRVAV